MLLRAATPSDISELLDMRQKYYAAEQYPFVASVAERAMHQLATDLSLGRLFVMESAGALVGYMAVTFGFSLEFGGRDAFLDELYVVPEARGRGLGMQALAVAELTCREAGITALHLEVDYVNSKAKALYARSGFVEHSRHLMTKWLSAVNHGVT